MIRYIISISILIPTSLWAVEISSRTPTCKMEGKYFYGPFGNRIELDFDRHVGSAINNYLVAKEKNLESEAVRGGVNDLIEGSESWHPEQVRSKIQGIIESGTIQWVGHEKGDDKDFEALKKDLRAERSRLSAAGVPSDQIERALNLIYTPSIYPHLMAKNGGQIKFVPLDLPDAGPYDRESDPWYFEKLKYKLESSMTKSDFDGLKSAGVAATNGEFEKPGELTSVISSLKAKYPKIAEDLNILDRVGKKTNTSNYQRALKMASTMLSQSTAGYVRLGRNHGKAVTRQLQNLCAAKIRSLSQLPADTAR
jgi:hypothetical protein